MHRTRKSQRGASVFIIICALLLLVGAAVGWSYYSKERLRTETARQEAFRVEALKSLEQKRKASEEAALVAEMELRKATTVLQQSFKAADDLVARWDDGMKVASATARVGLSAPVANLQAIQRDAGALVVPPCLAKGKGDLISGMQSTVSGFLAFMGNTGELANLLSKTHFDQAEMYLKFYRTARAACPAA